MNNTLDYRLSDSVPEKMNVFAVHKTRNSNAVCPVGIEFDGKVGVSDGKLMGLLSLLGHDPISDTPVSIGGVRLWWFFDDDHQMTIRKLVTAYYSPWTGDVGHISFVRACIEKGKAFGLLAKELNSKQFGKSPMTLRRL